MRPRYSREGYSGVARMGSTQFTAFVEGRNHDAVFYERMLMENDKIKRRGLHIVRAEDVDDSGTPGKGAGGKQAVIALFEFFRQRDELAQNSRRGQKHLFFFLDRDYDGFSGELIAHPNVIYTYGTDVEAEIFRLGNLQRSLATVFSMTEAESRAVCSVVVHFVTDLAFLWREWWELCIASGILRSRSEVRSSRPSLINAGQYGELDADLYEMYYRKMIEASQLDDAEVEFKNVREVVSDAYEEGRYFQIVKGKQIAPYIVNRVGEVWDFASGQATAKSAQLVVQMLETADYHDQTAYYSRRLLMVGASSGTYPSS